MILAFAEGAPLLAAIIVASLFCGFCAYMRLQMEPGAWWALAAIGAAIGWAYCPYVLIGGGIVLAVVLVFLGEKVVSWVTAVMEEKQIELRPPPRVIDVPRPRLLRDERKQEERKKEKKRSVRASRSRMLDDAEKREIDGARSFGEKHNLPQETTEEQVEFIKRRYSDIRRTL